MLVHAAGSGTPLPPVEIRIFLHIPVCVCDFIVSSNRRWNLLLNATKSHRKALPEASVICREMSDDEDLADFEHIDNVNPF